MPAPAGARRSSVVRHVGSLFRSRWWSVVLLLSSGTHGEGLARALGLLTRRRAGGSLLERS